MDIKVSYFIHQLIHIYFNIKIHINHYLIFIYKFLFHQKTIPIH